MAVVRVGKRKWTDNSVKQDGRRQPHYNLTPGAPNSHSEFEGDGARNACAYREHTQTISALYVRLDCRTN